jgi:hypothetical protein
MRRRTFLKVLGLGLEASRIPQDGFAGPARCNSMLDLQAAAKAPASKEYGLLTCANPNLVMAAARSRAGIFACTINGQTHCGDAGQDWGTSTWLNDLYFGLHGGSYIGGADQHDVFRRELRKIARHVQIASGRPPVPFAVSADGLSAQFNPDGMDLDRCAEFVLEVIRTYEITGDREFLAALYPNCLEVLKYLKARDLDGDLLPEGRTESFTVPPGKGVGGCASVSYIGDTVANTWKDFGAAMFYYEALERLAVVESLLGRKPEGEGHHQHATEVRKAIKKVFWNGRTDGFLAWIEKDGTAHDDWITGNNLHAILLGLPDANQSSRILAKLGRHRRDLEEVLPCRVRIGVYADGLCSNGPDYYWNGGIFPLVSMTDMRARALTNDLDGALRVAELLATCPKVTEYGFYEAYDGKTGEPNRCRGLLMDNGGFLWGLFAGVFGVEIRGEELRFRAVVPKELVPSKMRIHYRGADFEITWTTGRTRVARLDGKAITPAQDGNYSLRLKPSPGQTYSIEIVSLNA